MRLIISVLCLATVACFSALTGFGGMPQGLIALVLAFLVLAAAEQRHREAVWSALLWFSVACAALAAVQLPWIARPPGPFGSPNYLGAFAAVMLFVAWQRRHRVAMCGCALAVCLSQSRGAILAVVAGALVMLWRRHRAVAVCFAIAACAVAAGLHPQAGNARPALLKMGLAAWTQRPLTGWGVGGISPLVGHFYCTPLDWAIWTGLVGVAVAARLGAEAWIAAGKTETPAHRAALAAWFVQGLFLSPAWPTNLVLFALLADLVGRDVAHRAAGIDDGQPLLDGGV